jgi:hypothetical protein
MKETLPTLDMSGGSNQAAKDAKTVMSGQPEAPQTPPTTPWTPPPSPSSLPPVRLVAPPPAPAGGVGQTLVMAEPQREVPLAWLGVVSGPGAERGRTFTLLPETIIGRNAGDMLLRGDPTVSSQHAKVRLEPKEGGMEGEQAFVLYDLASANGTYAGTRENYSDDSSRVYRYELNNGDYVLLGETVLTFWRA